MKNKSADYADFADNNISTEYADLETNESADYTDVADNNISTDYTDRKEQSACPQLFLGECGLALGFLSAKST